MNETGVRYDSPNSNKKVVRIDTAATINGNRARKEAKTNASTANAPSPATIVSTSTLGPFVEPPELKAAMPVTPTWSPGKRRATAFWAATSGTLGPKPLLGGPKR